MKVSKNSDCDVHENCTNNILIKIEQKVVKIEHSKGKMLNLFQRNEKETERTNETILCIDLIQEMKEKLQNKEYQTVVDSYVNKESITLSKNRGKSSYIDGVKREFSKSKIEKYTDRKNRYPTEIISKAGDIEIKDEEFHPDCVQCGKRIEENDEKIIVVIENNHDSFEIHKGCRMDMINEIDRIIEENVEEIISSRI